MLKCASCFYSNVPDSGNLYSHANSECYIFNSTPAFFFIYHLHWLHWVIGHLYVFFTTPSPSTCVSKGSDGCGNEAEKEVSGDSAWVLLSFCGCTFWWLLALLSTFPLYTVVHRCLNSPHYSITWEKEETGTWRRPKNPYKEHTLNSLDLLQYCPLWFLSVCTNPWPDDLCHSCHYPGPTSLDGLSTLPSILQVFLPLAMSTVVICQILYLLDPHPSEFWCTPICNPAETQY